MLKKKKSEGQAQRFGHTSDAARVGAARIGIGLGNLRQHSSPLDFTTGTRSQARRRCRRRELTSAQELKSLGGLNRAAGTSPQKARRNLLGYRMLSIPSYARAIAATPETTEGSDLHLQLADGAID